MTGSPFDSLTWWQKAIVYPALLIAIAWGRVFK